MKAITGFHPEYAKDGYDFSLLGTLVHEVDESGGYDTDDAKLFKNQRKYTLISGTGCSCWDGDYEGWTDLTLAELRKLGKSWTKDYGASAALGEWITKNL